VRFCYFGTQNTVPYCQEYTPKTAIFSAILPTGIRDRDRLSIIYKIKIYFFIAKYGRIM